MSRESPERPPHGAVLAVVAASLPMFMAALDSLVMTFALPIIKVDLDASVEQLQWFVNAYSIVFTALMLPVAALGDLIGRRRVFLGGVVLFTAASIAAALASSSEMLIAARAVQGLGAAGIVPLSLALVSASTTAKARPIAIGVWGGVNGLGIAAGPIIGGAVVEGFTWPGIFWLNVPIGVVTVALVLVALRESTGRKLRFDVLGSVLGIVVTLPLIWAVVEGERRGWTDWRILAAFALSAVGLAAFILHEHRSPHAFLPLRFFRERAFALANFGGLLFSAGVFGAIFLLSQFLQVSMGYGALEAGLRAAPWTLAPMVVAPLSGFIVQRLGVKPVLITGLALQAAAILVIALRIEARDGVRGRRAADGGRGHRHGPDVRAPRQRRPHRPRRVRAGHRLEREQHAAAARHGRGHRPGDGDLRRQRRLPARPAVRRRHAAGAPDLRGHHGRRRGRHDRPAAPRDGCGRRPPRIRVRFRPVPRARDRGPIPLGGTAWCSSDGRPARPRDRRRARSW
ncbi:MFS transporter [Clavibacter michiganensis subsp. tessellarius]|uniref:MFS transporter n=1 Tax=Clavibacter tessellarius TaxID=31965 RepID=UPI003638E0B3